MIQEQKCTYTMMMKFVGFKAFGHATSSLVFVLFCFVLLFFGKTLK
jgi:hypothetical protein